MKKAISFLSAIFYVFLVSGQKTQGDSVVIKKADSLYNLTYDLVLSGAPFDSSYQVIENGLKLSEEHKDSISLALMLKAKSFWLFFQQRYEEGEAVAKHSLSIAIKKNIHELGKYYQGVATHQERQGKLEEALTYYLDGLEACKQQGDSVSMVPIYHGIMISYRTKGDHFKSIEFGKRAVLIAKRVNSPRLPNLINDMIFSFIKLNELDSALAYAFTVEAYLEKSPNNFVLCSLKKKMGTIYMLKQQYNDAESYFLESEQIARKAGWLSHAGYAIAERAEALLKQGKYSECIDAIEETLKLDIEFALKRDLAFMASEAHELQGNHERALSLYKEFKAKSDSLNKQMYSANVSELEVKFETAEKEANLKEQDNKILLLERNEARSKQRMILIVSSVLIVLIIGFSIARFIIARKERKAAELKKIGEFKEAMTGMIAHDLKNPLSILLNQADGDQTTKQMAGQMLQLVKNILDVHKFESTEVKLDLKRHMLDHLAQEAINQVRPLLAEKNINVELNLNSTLVLVDGELITRVFINFLTNAIKFSPPNSLAEIVGSEQGEHIKITVRDHGAGIPDADIEKVFQSFEQLDAISSNGVGSTGLGLTFCKLALKAHSSDIEVDTRIGEGTAFSFYLKKSAEMSLSMSKTEQGAVFTIHEEDIEFILKKIPMLRSMKLHQALKMEEVLEPVKSRSQASKKWVESVLNAAYTGNKEHFDELLESLENQNS